MNFNDIETVYAARSEGMVQFHSSAQNEKARRRLKIEYLSKSEKFSQDRITQYRDPNLAARAMLLYYIYE